MMNDRAEVSSRELTTLGQSRGIPVMEDLGSGSLIDLRPWGFPYEPTVPEVVASGVDLVSFSGDKLLGGPQAGIVVGKKAVVSRLKKNPWNRALRIDKFTIAALEATLSTLRPGDRVQLVAADLSGRPLADKLMPVGSEELLATVEKLRGELPLGSTDMEAALDVAASQFEADAATNRVVLYIGDGSGQWGCVGAYLCDDAHLMIKAGGNTVYTRQ